MFIFCLKLFKVVSSLTKHLFLGRYNTHVTGYLWTFSSFYLIYRCFCYTIMTQNVSFSFLFRHNEFCFDLSKRHFSHLMYQNLNKISVLFSREHLKDEIFLQEEVKNLRSLSPNFTLVQNYQHVEFSLTSKEVSTLL